MNAAPTTAPTTAGTSNGTTFSASPARQYRLAIEASPAPSRTTGSGRPIAIATHCTATPTAQLTASASQRNRRVRNTRARAKGSKRRRYGRRETGGDEQHAGVHALGASARSADQHDQRSEHHGHLQVGGVADGIDAQHGHQDDRECEHHPGRPRAQPRTTADGDGCDEPCRHRGNPDPHDQGCGPEGKQRRQHAAEARDQHVVAGLPVLAEAPHRTEAQGVAQVLATVLGPELLGCERRAADTTATLPPPRPRSR